MLTSLVSFSLFIVLFWFVFRINAVFAADPLTYTLLADLPGIDDTPEPADYLAGAIKLLIGLITALSVLMIVYAGVFGYVGGATSPAARSAANTQIQGALLGLILAISSYLILNEINPDLLSLDLKVTTVPEATVPGTSCVCPCPDPCVSNPSLPGCPDPCAGFCASTGACP